VGSDNVYAHLSTNAFAHLFDSIALYLNNKKIDSVKNVGITSTLLGCVKLANKDVGESAFGFIEAGSLITDDGHFCVSYPLRNLMGFADTYHKPIVCSNLVLELVRARSNDAFYRITKSTTQSRRRRAAEDVSAEIIGGGGSVDMDVGGGGGEVQSVRTKRDATIPDLKLEIEQIHWSLPKITLHDTAKIAVMKKLSTASQITMSFRTFNYFELKLPDNSTKTLWHITSVPLNEQPNWIILGLQEERVQPTDKDHGTFDQCDLRSLQVFVNQTPFPTNRCELEWSTNSIAEAYNSYLRFKAEYYEEDIEVGAGIRSGPLMSYAKWKSSPIYVVRLSDDFGEIAGRTSANLSVQLEAHRGFPNATYVYAILVQDRVVDYNAVSKIVYTE